MLTQLHRLRGSGQVAARLMAEKNLLLLTQKHINENSNVVSHIHQGFHVESLLNQICALNNNFFLGVLSNALEQLSLQECRGGADSFERTICRSYARLDAVN